MRVSTPDLLALAVELIVTPGLPGSGTGPWVARGGPSRGARAKVVAWRLASTAGIPRGGMVAAGLTDKGGRLGVERMLGTVRGGLF